jgi:putative heme-binding domain-containing protein
MSQLPAKHWYQRDPGVVPNMLHTGAGSPTGLMVYEGEMLPESLRGHLIHCDAGPSVTRAYVTAEQGAGYSAEIVNILEGTRDKWFRPSDVKAAPDGSIIVADWYDPGVGGHRMGDVERGRLFRVIPQAHGGQYTNPELDFSTAAGAIQALRSPNNSARYLAWTTLHKMGDKAEGELLKLWEDNNPRMQARALWLLGKIPGKGLKYVDLASRDDNKDIRCAAIRLARQLDDVDVLPVVARLVNDPSPAVRRECAIALRHNKSEEVAQLWAALAKQHDGNDRWYLEALGIAADAQWDRFMAAWLDAVDGNWDTPGGRDLVWRSRAKDTGKWLASVLGNQTVTADDLPRYFRAMDFLSEDQRDAVATKYACAKIDGGDARAQLIASESMRRISSSAVNAKPEYKKSLLKILDGMGGTKEFLSLVSKFNVREHYPDLLQMAQQDPEGQLGVEAMRVLLSKDGGELIKSVLNGDNVDVLNNTILALGSSADNRSSDLLANVVNAKAQDVEVRRNAVRAISKSRQGASRLLRGVERDRLDPSLKAVAAAALNRVRWQDIREKAQELLPVPATKGAEKLPSLGDLARMRGDATNGQKVFAGVGTCAKCHIVNNKGKEVGPNLTEIGTKLSREAMFEAILYPSAGISHNYEAYNLVDADGNQVTGLLTSATDAEVVITSDDGIARTFPRSEIELLEKQKVSLMPADLQKLMSKQELLDVVEYLTTLKKK